MTKAKKVGRCEQGKVRWASAIILCTILLGSQLIMIHTGLFIGGTNSLLN